MKSTEIKERLDKAIEKVDKTKATIERHKKQAEKKLQSVKDNGWDQGLTDGNFYRGDNYNFEALSAISDYEWKLEDIKGAEDKLKDAEQIVVNWKEKYDKQVDMETVIANEMPEIFRQCRDELAEEWTKQDIKRRETMNKKRAELSYDDFRKLYKYSEEMSYNLTDEEFKKSNLRDAELFIVDLYNRVKAITGEVTNWGNIYYGGKALNGWVEGENGKAKVETIGAGGYNIQRYHLRVLVHSI